MRTLPTIALIAAASTLLACDHVKGTGNVERRPLTVQAFHGIQVEGSMDVVLQKGPQRVEVAAQRNIADLVTTEVRNGIWTIATSKGYSTDKDFVVYITVPVIDEVVVNGSGNVKADDAYAAGRVKLAIAGSGDLDLAFEANAIDVDIHGSGDVRLSGSCGMLSTSIAGSGDVNARGLRAENADVRTAGSGDVLLTVTGSLDANIAGSGDISYAGSPKKVNSNVAGSGEVRQVSTGGRL